jgi:hypothetical protein
VKTALGAVPLVSVIVPTRPGMPGLAGTLDAVLGQTHAALQVLVLNPGAATPAGRMRDDARLVMVGAGAAPTVPEVLARIRGELVAVVDADDVWHAEKLERQIVHLRERPAVDVSLGYGQLFWTDMLADGSVPPAPRPMGAPALSQVLAAALVRAAAFARVGFFPTEPGRVADTEWFAHAYGCGLAVESLDELLLYRRLHRGNVARRLGADLPAALPDVMKALLNRRRGHPVPPARSGRPT